MPTVLDLAGIPVPGNADRLSLAGDETRDMLYGEHGEGRDAQRMIRKGDYKLIYFAEGNLFQLFNITEDPEETADLAGNPEAAGQLREMTELLKQNLYGGDREWLTGGEFTGIPAGPYVPEGDMTLRGQRGLRFM
jgi:arylsulfatase A-like enzyme